jgi:hypothetical protein
MITEWMHTISFFIRQIRRIMNSHPHTWPSCDGCLGRNVDILHSFTDSFLELEWRQLIWAIAIDY